MDKEINIIDVVEQAIGHPLTRETVSLADVTALSKYMEGFEKQVKADGQYGEAGKDLLTLFGMIARYLGEFVRMKRKHDKDAKYYANVARKGDKEQQLLEKDYARIKKRYEQLMAEQDEHEEYKDIIQEIEPALKNFDAGMERSRQRNEEMKKNTDEIMATKREKETMMWTFIDKLLHTDPSALPKEEEK